MEKVKSVCDKMRIGPQNFCENMEVKNEKIVFCPQMDFRAT